jgi:UDP-N-acetylmuramoylalanine--D-glutamate ligase
MPNAVIVGLGRSGVAAAKLLHRQGWQVSVCDRGESDSLRQQQQHLVQAGIPVHLSQALEPDPSWQLIVVSPGVPWDLPGLVRARELGIEAIGEMELAWRNLSTYPWVSITGTNGKTTTTALIAAIFQAAGLHAPACGNIGYAACELALEQTAGDSEDSSFDWIIAEVSSYQSESSSTLAPRIGVWTTFTPDHLSRHYTLENYFNIKAKLLNASQLQVLNGDDAYLRQHVWGNKADACWTSLQGKQHGDFSATVYIEDGWIVTQGKRLLPADALPMPGDHNRQNLLMAVAAAWLAGIEAEAIESGVRGFPGVPHRLEVICIWQGIHYINDSKATNYDAAQVGLSAVAAPAILIAGGEAKEGDDTAWLETIRAKAAAVLLIGAAAPAFASRLQQVGYGNYEVVETMEKAIGRSRDLAKQHQAATVLLSPACASFDQFTSFEQRGDCFRQLCQTLLVADC